MVVIHRPIRRLKDTFQYTRSYDESRSQQRIKGRRLLSTKKHSRLPFMEIKKCVTDDAQQRRLKTMLIEELNSFFRSRNDNSIEERQLNVDQRVETSNFLKENLNRVSPIPSDMKQTTIEHQGKIDPIAL